MLSKKEADSNSNEDEYYRTLYNPLSYSRGRIPSPFGVPTGSLALDSINILSTDANGNILMEANTQTLGTNVNGVRYTANASWDPNTDDVGGITWTNIGQANSTYLTSGNSFRLVAAQFKLTYIGAELYRSGVFFGCHNFNPSYLLSNYSMSMAQMQDSEHFKVIPTDRSLSIIYIPYDESYLEFTKQGVTTPDARYYNIVFGIRGGQASSSVVLLESKYIFEFIPPPSTDDTVERVKCYGNPLAIAQFNSDMVVRAI